MDGSERWLAGRASQAPGAGRFAPVPALRVADGRRAYDRNQSTQVMCDEDDRDRKSRKRVRITLVEEPSVKTTAQGRYILFRGVQEGQDRPMRALMAASVAERFDRDVEEDLSERLRRLSAGDELSIAGAWGKVKWMRNGVQQEFWEFKAQRFAEGDVPLDDIRGIHMANGRTAGDAHAGGRAARMSRAAAMAASGMSV